MREGDTRPSWLELGHMKNFRFYMCVYLCVYTHYIKYELHAYIIYRFYMPYKLYIKYMYNVYIIYIHIHNTHTHAVGGDIYICVLHLTYSGPGQGCPKCSTFSFNRVPFFSVRPSLPLETRGSSLWLLFLDGPLWAPASCCKPISRLVGSRQKAYWAWVLILVPSLTFRGRVTLARSLTISGSQFPHLGNETLKLCEKFELNEP